MDQRRRAVVRNGTVLEGTHVTPHGIRVILGLVENGSLRATLTVMGRAPGTTYRCVRGLLGSTRTGIRGGTRARVTTGSLIMDVYGINPKPVVGEVEPETRNETFEILGEASRVAVILSRGRWIREKNGL